MWRTPRDTEPRSQTPANEYIYCGGVGVMGLELNGLVCVKDGWMQAERCCWTNEE